MKHGTIFHSRHTSFPIAKLFDSMYFNIIIISVGSAIWLYVLNILERLF